MRYIGVDLAWGERAATGLAALDRDGHLIASDLRFHLDDITAFILAHCGERCLVGIDSPLVVPNESSNRLCEKELHRRGIRCYPANRKLLANADGVVRGEALVKMLGLQGFELTTDDPGAAASDRLIYEVFPRAVIRYYGYDPATGEVRSPRYKKTSSGKIKLTNADLLVGIRELRDLIRQFEPPVSFADDAFRVPLDDQSIQDYKVKQIKAAGDLLDAVICAYMVRAFHVLGREGGEVVGDIQNGYILIPPDSRKKEQGDAGATRGRDAEALASQQDTG